MRAPAVAVVAIAVALTAVAALPGVAAAQPSITPPLPVAPSSDPATLPGAKSEGVAVALSVGGTLASYAGLAIALSMAFDDDGNEGDNVGGAQVVGAISALGAVTAPSFGHWYAGKALTRGLGLRVVAGVTGVTALMVMESNSACEDCGDSGGAGILFVGALGLLAWGTIDDIVTAPRRVRAYNRGLVSDVAVVPIVRDGGGSIALTGRF